MGSGSAPRFEAVNAILTPPALERFRQVTGFDESPVQVRFDGWYKLAILGRDRVFLFPRNHLSAGAVEREVAALKMLAEAGVRVAPRLLGSWHDPDVYAYPFLAVERIAGDNWGDLEEDADTNRWLTVMETLGAAIAQWHEIPLERLPPPVRRPWAPSGHLARLLESDDAEGGFGRGADLLGASSDDAATWTRSLERVRDLSPVLVHGDVCENQLMVDASARVRAVIDWASPAVGTPLLDFDFGQWGYGIFAHEARWGEFRRVLWGSYARARGLASPDWIDVHLLFSLADAVDLAARAGSGSPDDFDARRRARSRANLEEATRVASGR